MLRPDDHPVAARAREVALRFWAYPPEERDERLQQCLDLGVQAHPELEAGFDLAVLLVTLALTELDGEAGHG